MGVVRANIQTVEDIYQLIWTAIASKRPIEAVYKGLPRLFCPHRLGRNREGELRVLCYQYGGESESGLEAPGSPANWRCTALEKYSQVKLREALGARHRIIPALHLVWSKLILTPRISHPYRLRRKDSEATARAVGGQFQSAT
jgi:hypothetical protein